VLAHWKPVEVMVPVGLSPRQVLDRIHAQIRINATEAGDFVQRIQTGSSQRCSDEFIRCTAFYLPGPPAPFPHITNEP
jgi:hypothetical protein